MADASDLQEFELDPIGDTKLRPLLRRRRRPGGPPVLLIHGASAHSGTFEIPEPDGSAVRCLRDWLWEQGYEPWLLDWRGSARVAWQAKGDLGAARELLDLDGGAAFDIPAALDTLCGTREEEDGAPPRVRAVAHCLGAAALCQALAQGKVPRVREAGDERSVLTHLVLSTVGLFYVAPLDGQVKVWDPVLERVWDEGAHSIDPHDRRSWPREFHVLYENWTRALRAHDAEGPENSLCNSLSFMYGAPYLEKNLVPEIHRDAHVLGVSELRWRPDRGVRIRGRRSGASARLDEVCADGEAVVLTDVEGEFSAGEPLCNEGQPFAIAGPLRTTRPRQLHLQFGPIPLRLYLQASRNLRRGCAAPFTPRGTGWELTGPEARARFAELTRITLITGAKNQLWHRSSIDRMHEWLSRGARRRHPPVKHVLPGYGHQDLFWGRRAACDVFPKIAEGLTDADADA